MSKEQLDTKEHLEHSTISCIVLGATGYAGSELISLLLQNKHFNLLKAFNSSQSSAIYWHEIAPQQTYQVPISLAYNCPLLIEPWSIEKIKGLAVDAAFLALPHEASAQLAPELAQLGIKVFDLSGAFRLKDADIMQAYYGFTPKQQASNRLGAEQKDIPYMLMPWLETAQINNYVGNIYAIPGCYPTAALLALKPLQSLNLIAAPPVITAMSGVSGAGRGAKESTSFCEVSLQAYGILKHRHQPEITQYLGTPVVFTPVLVALKRGILSVAVVQLSTEISEKELQAHYSKVYQNFPLVRVVQDSPAVDHVVHTNYCHLHVAVQDQTAVITSTLDNLRMGAASQAMQAAHAVFKRPLHEGF